VANRDVDRARRVAAGIPGAAARGLESVGAIARQMDLVVNATPVGMHPDAGSTLLTREDIRPGQVVFDTVYNPPETRLLAEARAAGALALNGVKMLVHQGAESLRLWLGVEPPVDAMEEAVRGSLAAFPSAEGDAP
jgi:shikimate dehydrogenase